ARKNKAVGALGLAIAGAYPEPIDENAFVVRNRNAVALAVIGRREAVPFLIDALANGGEDFWGDTRKANALALLGDDAAIPLLRACLQDEGRHALDAFFRALIILGDERQAVPLAINRVGRESRFSASSLSSVLERVTGQN